LSVVLQEGELLQGRFEVERLAGLGGMSTVYRAVDRATGDPVAIKVLGGATEVDEARFEREGRLLASISHPAIVRYVAHGATASRAPFLAMEWLEGESLAARLAAAPLTLEESLAIGRRVAEALAEAHHRGVIHRDVKPSNVLLVDGDPAEAKVLDFGLARLAMPTRAVARTGTVIGTLGYMAPEQARGERDLDPRTDVFALGCVLYECMCGRTPFTGKDVVAVLVKILSGRSPRLADVRPDIPRALDELVGKMMARRREDRPADGSAAASALAEVGASTTVRRAGRSRATAALSRGEQRLVSRGGRGGETRGDG
jgi:serine/threonine protein kinase